MRLSPWSLIGKTSLSTRAKNALVLDGWTYVGEVRLISNHTLMRIPNLGTKSLAEIRKVAPFWKKGSSAAQSFSYELQQARSHASEVKDLKAALTLAQHEARMDRDRATWWQDVANRNFYRMPDGTTHRPYSQYEKAVAVARQSWTGPFHLAVSGTWIETPAEYAEELARLGLHPLAEPNWGLEWIDAYQVNATPFGGQTEVPTNA